MTRVEARGRIRLIAFDRPDKLNALNAQLYAESAAALEDAARDENCGAVVLTGEGRAFCSGVDVTELQASATGDATAGFTEAAERFLDVLNEYPKPLLAAVNGLAVGIGTTMLTYADLVFAAESARFRTPFAPLGVAPEAGSSWRLPRMMGWQNAAWMLFSAEWVDAQQARELGLVFRVCSDEQLLDETLAAAQTIAAHPVDSLRAIKRTLSLSRQQPSRTARESEGEVFSVLLAKGFRSPL